MHVEYSTYINNVHVAHASIKKYYNRVINDVHFTSYVVYVVYVDYYGRW